MNAFGLWFAIAASGLALSGPATPAPVHLITVHYELDVRMDYAEDRLEGTASITVENPGDGPVTDVPLLLYRLMSVSAVRDSVGKPLAFDQDVVRFEDFDAFQVTAVRVHLPQPLARGGRTTVTLDYAGRLLGYSETPNRYVHDRIDPEFTILRDDAYAFPLLDVPSLAAHRARGLESYDYVARITVPDSLVVANGGRLVDTRRRDGWTTYEYRSLKPSWRMDFAIARYGRLDRPPLRIYYLEQDSAGATAVGRAAQACLELFTHWFGPLEATPTLTFLEIPNGFGSQQDVTTILQTAAAFQDPTRYHEIYHELAHLWQADITDKPMPRWNEGLATFLEMLAAEKLDGPATVDRRADQLLDWLRDSAAKNPRWTEVPMIDYGKAGLNDLAYSVGALFFDLLYRIDGPEAFDRSLNTWYHRFARTGSSTADLVATLSAGSPVDLEPLVRDWVFTTGWAQAIQDVKDIHELAALYLNSPSAAPREARPPGR